MNKDEMLALITTLTTAENADSIETIITGVNEVFDQVGTEVENTDSEWKGKFEALQQKYVDRFMSGDGTGEEPPEDTPEEPEETPEDTSTIDDLFKKEGE